MALSDEVSLLSYLPVIAFIVGICVGSFVTMASYRIPHGDDLVFRPSHCPHCEHVLTFKDLFPLLSWLWQRGKCRWCRAPVSPRYPLIELALGLTFFLIARLYGAQASSLFFALLATELAILIVTDLEHYIIPDSLQIALLVTGLCYRCYSGAEPQDVAESIMAYGGLGLALHYGYRYLRNKDALGWGDVKFLAVTGIWLPLDAFVPFLFIAGVMGTVTGLFWRLAGRGALFPFAPALALSLFINVLAPGLMLWLGLGR